jgi:hypothetical protein
MAQRRQTRIAGVAVEPSTVATWLTVALLASLTGWAATSR